MVNQRRSGNITGDLSVVAGSYNHILFGWAIKNLDNSCTGASCAEDAHEVVRLFEYQPHVSAIRCIATNGIYLATGSDDETVKIYNLKKRSEAAILDHHSGSITCVSFFNNEYLFSSSLDGKISIIRIKDYALLHSLEGHKKGVTWFAVHPSGKVLLSVGANLSLKVWDLLRGTCTYSMRLDSPARKIFWSLTGEVYYIVYEDTIEILDTANGHTVKKLKTERMSTALCVKVDLDLKLGTHTEVLVVSETSGEVHVHTIHGLPICSWNANFSSRLKTIYATDCSIRGGPQLIACSFEGMLKLWDLKTVIQMAVLSPGTKIPEHISIKSGSRLTCIAAYQ